MRSKSIIQTKSALELAQGIIEKIQSIYSDSNHFQSNHFQSNSFQYACTSEESCLNKQKLQK